MKARVVRFHKTGGPEVLQIETVDVAEPKAGQVRIRVKALGLNRAESAFRLGQYLEAPTLPAKLGYEAAGTVDAVGPGVTEFQVGDAVSTVPGFSQNAYGVYGELALAPVAAVVKHPANLSFEQASAIWMQYLTAYGAIIGIAALKAGDTLLIPAASSSVGIAAIQLANMVGAVPIALTRTSAKREALSKLGAAHVVATGEQDLVAEIQKITGGQGARVVFDPVGGPYVKTLAGAMARGGILFQYGALSSEPTPLPLMELIGKLLWVRGYTLFEVTGDPAKLKTAVEYVVGGLASGKLTPVIAKTFQFDQIVDAHRYLESNQQVGKIVVKV